MEFLTLGLLQKLDIILENKVLLPSFKLAKGVMNTSCLSKGQVISKCPFGVFKSPKKTNEIFVGISALGS